jgi:Na+/glutamate symporter
MICASAETVAHANTNNPSAAQVALTAATFTGCFSPVLGIRITSIPSQRNKDHRSCDRGRRPK